jgi:hypothetical protein
MNLFLHKKCECIFKFIEFIIKHIFIDFSSNSYSIFQSFKNNYEL